MSERECVCVCVDWECSCYAWLHHYSGRSQRRRDILILLKSDRRSEIAYLSVVVSETV